MALTQASLSSKIQTEIIALYGAPDDSSRLKEFADAIAKAVVDEIQENAEVAGTANVSGGSSAGSHPVVGTVS